MAKVLITGGTGLIGSSLTNRLLESGHDVVHLSRNPENGKGVPTFAWNPQAGTMDEKALEGVTSIIHLAGAPIAEERWTEERRRIILESRTKTSQLLYEALERNNIKLKHFISASAIGWYPLIISDNKYDESSPPGTGFLAEVCQEWEKSADMFKDRASNVAKLRIGLVLDKAEGALAQIARPIRLYIGSPLGSGRQFMSWIHLDDVTGMFEHILENNLNGIYNAVGPEPMRNAEFIQTVADVIDRPILLPSIPEFVIKLLFGGTADLVLKGVPISSKKIVSTGYEFEYPTLSSALFNLYW